MGKSIGFDQRIQRHHLDFAARESTRTKRRDMYRKLDTFLSGDILGKESRKKTITVLMRIWYPLAEKDATVQRAIAMWPELLVEEQLVLHWGMTIRAHPFFAAVAEILGQGFHLQGQITSRQIHQKIRAMYSDRRKVRVATTAVLSSMKDWGVLAFDPHQGYRPQWKLKVNSSRLKLWLAEVILKASGYEIMPLDMLCTSPMLFPFHLQLNPRELEEGSIAVQRQGMELMVVSKT